MKTRATMVFVVSLMVAAGTSAQIDPDPDGIGIYFNEEATQNSTFADPGETVSGYLVATNITQEADIVYWEATVSGEENTIAMYGAPRGDSFNGYSNTPGVPFWGFAVYYFEAPLLNQGVVVLADLFIELGETDAPSWLYISELNYSYPVYQVGGFDSPYHDMYVSSGDMGIPVAVVNGAPPIPARNETWSGIRELYW